MPHREWGCASPGMGVCLTGNAQPSQGMGMCLTGNRDVTHQKCTSSPRMHILTGNAPSLYRVSRFQVNRTKIRSKTENGRNLCLWETKFSYDVTLTSRLAITSSILFTMLDFIYF